MDKQPFVIEVEQSPGALQQLLSTGVLLHRITIEFEAEGYLARAIQHEVDHLDGVLFVDRLSLLKRQFLRRELEAIARGELPEDYRPPREGLG